MLNAALDHVVITAPSLALGVEYVRGALGGPGGVPGPSPQAGGEHARMGTHNCLLRLGSSLYLEVIAINPDAPRPDRPRWFRLDDPAWNTAARLATWVMRTNDLRAAAAAAPDSFGNIEAMSRGALHWLITIPEDGSLPFDGVAPALIQWSTETHPAAALPDQGCSLLRLEGAHPQAAKIWELLGLAGFRNEASLVSIQAGEKPALRLQIQTPQGVRLLGT